MLKWCRILFKVHSRKFWSLKSSALSMVLMAFNLSVSLPPFLSPCLHFSWKCTSSANVPYLLRHQVIQSLFLCHKAVIALFSYALSNYWEPALSQALCKAWKDKVRRMAPVGLTGLPEALIYRVGSYLTFCGARNVSKAKTLENQKDPKYSSFCIICMHSPKRSQDLMYFLWI